MATKLGFQVVATLEWVETTEYRSESHMETAIFSWDTAVEEIMLWAAQTKNKRPSSPDEFHGHLVLTIAQTP